MNGPEALLKEAQAAEFLSISARTLRKLRESGQIDYVKIGGAVRYSDSDLRRFVDERRVKCVSTKDLTAKSGGSMRVSKVVDIEDLRAKRASDRRK